MLTIVGGLTEFEREPDPQPHTRRPHPPQEPGQDMGRPFKMTAYQKQEALTRRESGELLSEIARSYNVSSITISRLET